MSRRSRRPLRLAFTPTHDRPEMYRELVAGMKSQVDEFLTIAHGADAVKYARGSVVEYTEALPDLSVMWNIGLEWAERVANGRPYYVAGLNDDAMLAPDWFERMIEAIEREGSAGASTPRAPGKPKSIFGGAWVVKGGLGIRMSGVARWYYTDDEIQKQCSALGGFTIVPNVHAVNRLANESTAASRALQAMNSEDWPRFKAKYGLPAEPWHNDTYHVILSAPSGVVPQHLIDTLAGRPYTVMMSGWETDQLEAAARAHRRFVFLKESARVFPGFWEAIDSEPGSAWFFARPSCYMGIYESRATLHALRRMPRTINKEGSIRSEWRIHGYLDWRTIWPDVTDANALRMDGDELVIGNAFIEKSKGNARCGNCATTVGVCEHLRPATARRFSRAGR